MANNYDDEQITKLKQVNAMLQEVLEECQELVRQAELSNQRTGQDNCPANEKPVGGV